MNPQPAVEMNRETHETHESKRLGGGVAPCSRTQWCVRSRSSAPRPAGRFSFSPNGAAPYQPRAEWSAALGWSVRKMPSPEGASHTRCGRENGPPLQGLDVSPRENLGRCPRLLGRAPLRLNHADSPAAQAARLCHPLSFSSLGSKHLLASLCLLALFATHRARSSTFQCRDAPRLGAPPNSTLECRATRAVPRYCPSLN